MGVLVGLGYGASAVGAATWVVDLVTGETRIVDWLIHSGWGHLVLVLAGAA